MTKPYYQDDWVTIYHGDCREILPELSDKSIDLTLTSPPFNLGGNYHHTGNYRHKPYADDLPEIEYRQNQIEILDALYDIVKSTGSLWYQHKNRIKNGLSSTPYEWLLKTKWQMKQEIVWVNGSQNFDKCRFYPMTERIYWLVKDKHTRLDNIVNRHDDWHIEPVGTNTLVKRAFPEELAQTIIVCFPTASQILDPFLGSGTTAYCAKKLGRKCIGIEIEERYCEIASKRCSQTVMQMGDLK